MNRRISTLLGVAGPPTIVLAVVVVAWAVAVRASNVPGFLVPSPDDVVRMAFREAGQLARATAVTARAAAVGFGFSLAVGVAVALVFSQSRWVRGGCYPYVIFLQTVPIIAVAPLIVTWFGYGFHSVVLVTVVISVFPIIASTTAGLVQVDRDLLELFRLYGATRWQLLAKLRLPHAVPSLVTGARTSSGMAVIGAIVGEFFVGHSANEHGLGYLVLFSSAHMKTEKLFCVVIASALLGIALFGGVSLIGATVLSRWYHRPDRGEESSGGSV